MTQEVYDKLRQSLNNHYRQSALKVISLTDFDKLPTDALLAIMEIIKSEVMKEETK